MLSHMTHRARALRASATCAEHLLWEALRARRMCGAKFRRQAPLGPFIVDFYCAAARLVIEADGARHFPRPVCDDVRDAVLRSAGITVLRFANEQILHDRTRVLETIAAHLRARFPAPSGSGAGGEGPPSKP